MKTLTRVQFGNPILRKRAKKIPLKQIRAAAFQRLIKEMFLTIHPIGVGLAAPQIGKSIQLIVIDIHPLPHRPNVKPYKRVIINPIILESSNKQTLGYEGCLSFEGLRAEASRPKQIHVRYYDEHGTRQEEWVNGFIAKVFQHEIDHLNGVLFIDHVKNPHTIMTTEEFKKRVGRL